MNNRIISTALAVSALFAGVIFTAGCATAPNGVEQVINDTIWKCPTAHGFNFTLPAEGQWSVTRYPPVDYSQYLKDNTDKMEIVPCMATSWVSVNVTIRSVSEELRLSIVRQIALNPNNYLGAGGVPITPSLKSEIVTDLAIRNGISGRLSDILVEIEVPRTNATTTYEIRRLSLDWVDPQTGLMIQINLLPSSFSQAKEANDYLSELLGLIVTKSTFRGAPLFEGAPPFAR